MRAHSMSYPRSQKKIVNNKVIKLINYVTLFFSLPLFQFFYKIEFEFYNWHIDYFSKLMR